MSNDDVPTASLRSLELYMNAARAEISELLRKFNWDKETILSRYYEEKSKSSEAPCKPDIDVRLESGDDSDIPKPISTFEVDEESPSISRPLSVPEVRKLKKKSGNLEAHGNLSRIEEMALDRDLKRRRVKYKVSNKRPRYTEVLREIIDDHMKYLEERYSEVKHSKRHKLRSVRR